MATTVSILDDLIKLFSIKRFKRYDIDEIHETNILVNVTRCKDICYCDGYVYFLGYDMIGRINMKQKKF